MLKTLFLGWDCCMCLGCNRVLAALLKVTAYSGFTVFYSSLPKEEEENKFEFPSIH